MKSSKRISEKVNFCLFIIPDVFLRSTRGKTPHTNAVNVIIKIDQQWDPVGGGCGVYIDGGTAEPNIKRLGTDYREFLSFGIGGKSIQRNVFKLYLESV